PSDVAAVMRQLGPIQTPLASEPDIIVRFVDSIEEPSTLRYIGVNEAGFTEDAFFVLKPKGDHHIKAKIALSEIGRQSEIICESGIGAVPHLIAMINLIALEKGILALHASAFTYRDTGVLVTGWAKGGKTEALFAFMSNGANYIGDEWIYIGSDGRSLWGIPEPIRVWDWHLQDLPRYRARVDRKDQMRLRALNSAHSAARAASAGHRGTRFGGRPLARLDSLVERQRFVHIPPHTLFGGPKCALEGSLDKVFFVVSHESSTVEVRPSDSEEIARRMVFSLEFERLNFLAEYLRFRFAFPDAMSPLLEGAADIQKSLLENALKDTEAFTVVHPYPAPIPELFHAMSKYV
ncbi:MAG: hypothetical protein ACRDJL_05045, partial [Actinomycetota bacterium]